MLRIQVRSVNIGKIWTRENLVARRRTRFYFEDGTVLTFESNDFLLRVHNGRVGRDRSSHNIVGVGEVNDHYLVLLPYFLPYTDKVV